MSVTTAFTFTASTTADAAAAAYQAADVSTKAAMRADVQAAITSAIMAADVDLAQHLVAVQAALVAAKAAAPVVDWTARVADLRATLLLAVARIDDGLVVGLPEGVTVDLSAIGDGTPDEARAQALSTVVARKATRGAVAAWIESVLPETGAMRISDMRAAWVATADYPKEAPSAGAIGACLDRVADGKAEADFEVVTITTDAGAKVKGAQRA